MTTFDTYAELPELIRNALLELESFIGDLDGVDTADDGTIDAENAVKAFNVVVAALALHQQPATAQPVTAEICEHLWATTEIGKNSNRPFCQGCGLDWQAVLATENKDRENARLRATIEQLQAKLHCMCGSPMDHSPCEGHSPVSMFDHAVEQEVQQRLSAHSALDRPSALALLHGQAKATAASIRTRCGQIEAGIKLSATDAVRAIDKIADATNALLTAALDLENALRHDAQIAEQRETKP